MRKLQENLLIRLAAWVLFLVAVWGCAVFGQKTILGLSCVNDSIPQDTGRFSRVLDDYIGRVKVYVDSQNALTGALDFETEQIYRSEVKQKEEELNRSNTNFLRKTEAKLFIPIWMSLQEPWNNRFRKSIP